MYINKEFSRIFKKKKKKIISTGPVVFGVEIKMSR